MPPETAECRYREAMALAGELSMRPLVAHCHLGLGGLYSRLRQPNQAQEHLAVATTMVGEMHMRLSQEQDTKTKDDRPDRGRPSRRYLLLPAVS